MIHLTAGLTFVNPASTNHGPNASSMLVHRLRRWPNIEPALGPLFGFSVLFIFIYSNHNIMS